MSDALKKLVDQLRTFIAKMPPRARLTSALLFIVVAGALTYVVAGDHTKYVTLFSGLSTTDGAKIAEQLKKKKVAFRLRASGSTIQVSADHVHETRLALAGQGLPRGGGVGYEIFDTQKFGVSDFAQQVNYRRALQGELERTISQIEAVKTVRTHLAMTGRQLFARKERRVSASVTLKLHAGRTISRGTVRAIVHLVSSSVSGLAADAVTVVDTRGNMLWSGKSNGLAGGNEGPLEFKQSLENTLERRVKEILAAALGPNRAVVKVAADVALSRSERTEESFDPDKAVIRSESLVEDKQRKSANAGSGVAGVRGNLPGGSTAKTTKGGSGNERKRVTRNYEINRVIKKKTSPAGDLRRLSVAVLIDQSALRPSAATDKKGKKPSPVDIKSLEQVVRQAVGYSAARGDVVTVRAVQFAAVSPLPPVDQPHVVVRVIKQIPWTAVGGGFLLLVVAFALLRHRKSSSSELLQLPRTVDELEAQAQVSVDGEGPSEDAAAPQLDGAQARQLAVAAADQDAARAAQVLRAWMAGG